MAMGGPSSERFYAAATYVGFDGSPSPSSTGVSSKFANDVALLLYALYQQATVGPCNVSKPRGWSPAEQSKWTSWHGLGNMASAEAMRLFVKILEEEDPGWYSRASNFIEDPVVDVEMTHKPTVEPIVENGHSTPEKRVISTEIESLDETQDKDVVSEGSSSVAVYDQWVAAPTHGKPPKSRYEHGAAVIRDKMYVFAGNRNGRYLRDLHVLDMSSWTWSKINAKCISESSNSSDSLAPCAGHSLISWDNKILSVAGHTKDPSETIQVKAFNPQTEAWSTLKTYGKAPSSRGGQSVTLVRNSLVIFGGQDAKRSMLNDLHILDLESMTWDEFDAQGVPPPPRSDHAAAVHAERYVLIFGGGSHATCFNDLHVLDLQTMEWSRPKQKGYIPTPRAGHGGVTIGENWFIVGGGDNKSGVSETVVLNMSTLVWSVVSTAGRASIASEGLSLVVSSYNGEDVLVSFGGYNGHYNNEVNILKPSHKSDLQSKIIETPVNGSASALPSVTHATQDVESELHSLQDGIREISLDKVDLNTKKLKGDISGDFLATIKAEKEELESSLNNEKLLSAQLKQELSDAEKRNTEQHKELQAIRGQLAAEQSRCFKLEVDVAEMRQKVQSMEALQKELELLKRQKAASSEEEAAALLAKRRQSSGGVWSWMAGTPPRNQNSDF